jgi:hypothetical protein
MGDVWQRSTEVLDYLANADFHSPGVSSAQYAAAELPRVSMADFVGAVVYVNGRIPRGFDFARHVFQTLNPQAAQGIVDRPRADQSAIEAQSLGAFGLSGEAFVEHACQLARDESPGKGLHNCVIVVQESPIGLDSGGAVDTVLCSHFRSKDAREVVLPSGESLDGLLQ